MEDKPAISIIGAGKVGTAIGMAAAKAGWPVVAVASRSRENASAAAQAIAQVAQPFQAVHPQAGTPAAPTVCSIVEAAQAARIVLLTVSDWAIEEVCKQIAAAMPTPTEPLKGDNQGGDQGDGQPQSGRPVLAHCSGSLTSDLLASAKRVGFSTASMHPLQTFPTAQAGLERIPGTYFFIEGQMPAIAALERLAQDIGGKPVHILAPAKAFYHAAACAASNFMATLIDFALNIGERADIAHDVFLPALGPLILATARNIIDLGPAKALTGPIARGDVATLRTHFDALTEYPNLGVVYANFAGLTIYLAAKKGLSEDRCDALGGELTKFMQELISGAQAHGGPDPTRPKRQSRGMRPRKPRDEM
jgi:predicted short-subunit dehydrogenase-like oxidoreductase (DUF2520 family)